MSSTEWTYLVLRSSQFVAEWLKGDKDPRAWKLSLLIDLGYVAWAVMIWNPALMAFTAMSGLIHARNLWCWTKERCPEKPSPTSPSDSPPPSL